MTTPSIWPIDDIRIGFKDLMLRPTREVDLEMLASLQPADYEHDPAIQKFPFHSRAEHRARLIGQAYWRARGHWSPESWSLDFLVFSAGRPIGVQSLEAENFHLLRTVETGSWLIRDARGRGRGVAMRQAVLGFAFDHLGAAAAVSSARTDNHASLGVSRHCGYQDNGVELTLSESGPAELRRMRLTAEGWKSREDHGQVEVTGLDDVRRWFGVTK